MLHKTRGIVLRTTDYSESSVIVQIFTEKFGLQSYLINGVKKSKAKIRMNMLQPLHLLDMVVYHKPAGNIQRISELRNSPVLENIPYDIIKSSITIFLNEVLYRTIRHHSADERLFGFLYSSIEILDHLERGIENFHLWFLLHLSMYLGFFPDRTASELAFFDLKDGCFTSVMPLHPHIIEGPLARSFSSFLIAPIASIDQIELSGTGRKQLLLKVLEYYRLHTENFGDIKSHTVLEEILH